MLPFSSCEEAEAAIGRPLSAAELVWLKFTAHVEDSTLYFMNVLFLFVIFNLAPLPTVLIDLWSPASAAFKRYKIQQSVKNPPVSIWNCYKTVMLTFIFVVVPLQLSSYPVVKFVGIRTSLPLPSVWEVIAQLTVYFLIEDYGNYWLHRWLHSEWGYNSIHYMHHEFTAPVSLAAPYAHWAEILILGLPSFVGPALVPGHMITLWLWIALRQIEAIDTHSGYEFPWSITKLIPFYGGSDYHDYHHYVGGKSQSNFASVFTYCDYIYGTDKGYRYKKKMDTEAGGKKEL